MKVLHVNNVANIGFGLCKELRKQGITADLICKQKSIDDNYLHDWIITTSERKEEIRLKDISLDEYDIIHCHYLTNPLSIGLKIRNPQIPIILHAHGSDTRPSNIFLKIVQRFVSSMSDIMLYSTPDLLNNIKWFK